MGQAHKPKTAGDPWDSASLVLGAVVLVAAFTLGDYGMSWDEWFRWRGGQEKLLFYLDWLAGRTPDPNPRGDPDSYPGLFDLTVALLNHWFRISPFWAGHSLSLICGLLAFAGAWKIARFLGGPALLFSRSPFSS